MRLVIIDSDGQWHTVPASQQQLVDWVRENVPADPWYLRVYHTVRRKLRRHYLAIKHRKAIRYHKNYRRAA